MAREIIIANLTMVAALPFFLIGDANLIFLYALDVVLAALVFTALFRSDHRQITPLLTGVIAVAGLAIIVTSGVFISIAIDRFVATAPRHLDKESWAALEFIAGLFVAFNIGVLANENAAAGREKQLIKADVSEAYLQIWTASESFRNGVIGQPRFEYEGRQAIARFAARHFLHSNSMPDEQIRAMQRQIRDYVQFSLQNPAAAEVRYDERMSQTLRIAAKYYWLGGRRFRFTNACRVLADRLFRRQQ